MRVSVSSFLILAFFCNFCCSVVIYAISHESLSSGSSPAQIILPSGKQGGWSDQKSRVKQNLEAGIVFFQFQSPPLGWLREKNCRAFKLSEIAKELSKEETDFLFQQIESFGFPVFVRLKEVPDKFFAKFLTKK